MIRWVALVVIAVVIAVVLVQEKERRTEERERAAEAAEHTSPVDAQPSAEPRPDATPQIGIHDPLKPTYTFSSFTALRDPGDPMNNRGRYHGLSIAQRVKMEKAATRYVFDTCSRYEGWERVTVASAQFDSPGDRVHYEDPLDDGDSVAVSFIFGTYGEQGSFENHYKVDLDSEGEPLGFKADGNMRPGMNGARARTMCPEAE